MRITEEIADEDLNEFVHEMYGKAISNPGSSLHRGRFSMTYDANSFRIQAILTYEHSSALDENDADWLYLQALVHVELGNTEAALRSMEKSLQRDPTYISAKL